MAAFLFANKPAYAWQEPSLDQLYQKLDTASDAIQKEAAIDWIQAYSDKVEDNDRLAAKYHETLASLLRLQSKYDSGLYHVKEAVGRLTDDMPKDERAKAYITLASLYHNLGDYENSRTSLESARLLATTPANKRAIAAQEMSLYSNERDSQKYHEVLKQFLALTKGDSTLQGRKDKVFALNRVFRRIRAKAQPDTLNKLIDQSERALREIPSSSKYQFSVRMDHVRYYLKQKQFKRALDKLTQLDSIVAQVSKKELQADFYRSWIDLWNSSARAKTFQNQYLNTKDWLYPPEVCVARLNELYPDLRPEAKETVLKILIKYHKRIRNWERATRLSQELYRLEVEDFQKKINESYIKDRELTEENTRLRELTQQNEIELRNQQLREARINQRMLAAGIIMVLIFGYFAYRNSRHRKQQNMVLARQKADIEKMDELKSKFFVNISHELRTPLTLILGNTQNSIKGKFGDLGDRQRKALKNIEANSRRIFSLVQDMLDLSKLESGNQELNIRPVNIQEKINSVVSLFDYQLSSKAIEVKQEGIDENTILYLDPFKFETILFNLIGNAIKYSYNHANIQIDLSQTDEHVALSIINQGEGIPETDLPYLFDRFFQSGATDSGEGTGVGLALTKELVELHQGSIKVTSELTGETRFTLTFKQGKDHFDPSFILEEAEPLVTTSPNQSGLASILVVEDNAEMRNFIQELLSSQFKVLTASNGREGLELLAEEYPDLIITDYMMPEMNGPEFFRKVRAQKAFEDTPIIFLSARAIAADRQSLLLEGVDDYLLKPFEEETLLNRVLSLLSLKTEREKYKESNHSTDVTLDFMSQVKAIITELLSDSKLSPAVLADRLSVSERSLYRKVKEATGYTPLAYVKELRLQEARKLITAKVYKSIAEVALNVGFEDHSHFSRTYKKRFGKLPSEE
ncbi:MAG: hypothetical protein Roseis2KO_31980 [Roseivirga sp.]